MKTTKTGKIGSQNNTIIKQLNNAEDIQLVATKFLQIVDKVDNPRTRHCDSPLNEILFLAVLCGATFHEDMATLGEAPIEWFKQLIPLENGLLGCWT